MGGVAIKAQAALITGSSRGIGRGIALKLAECGVKRIGVHYLKNRAAAEETVGKLRERGAEGVLVQADVSAVDDIARMFAQAREALGSLDVFVSNARPDIEQFYQPAFDIPLRNWQIAFDSQARAFLLGVREAVEFMNDGGRIVAVPSPASRTRPSASGLPSSCSIPRASRWSTCSAAAAMHSRRCVGARVISA